MTAQTRASEPQDEAVGGGEIPRYRLLQASPMDRGDGFLQMFEAGTVFESRALPGIHWEPMNASAEKVLSDWLDEKVVVLNKDFEPTDRTITRRAILGMPNSPIQLAAGAQEPTSLPESRIIAVPKKSGPTGLELAQARFGTATPYSAPPPATVPDLDQIPMIVQAAAATPGRVPIPAVRR